MIEDKMKIPQFPTEGAEAEWWADHQDLLIEEFERAEASGAFKSNSVARKARESGHPDATSIRLAGEDISRARALAAKRGVSYERYLESLIHEALEAEEKKLAS
jgi:predicted DNA binding CopG/RHH family protein